MAEFLEVAVPKGDRYVSGQVSFWLDSEIGWQENHGRPDFIGDFARCGSGFSRLDGRLCSLAYSEVTVILFRDLFPELSQLITNDLHKNYPDLSSQFTNLRVVDRCPCGDSACGAFYTQEDDLANAIETDGTDILLECGVTVTEVNGKLVGIETLDPNVTAILLAVVAERKQRLHYQEASPREENVVEDICG